MSRPVDDHSSPPTMESLMRENEVRRARINARTTSCGNQSAPGTNFWGESSQRYISCQCKDPAEIILMQQLGKSFDDRLKEVDELCARVTDCEYKVQHKRWGKPDTKDLEAARKEGDIKRSLWEEDMKRIDWFEKVCRDLDSARSSLGDEKERHTKEVEEQAAEHAKEVEEQAAEHAKEVEEAAKHAKEVEEQAAKHAKDVEELQKTTKSQHNAIQKLNNTIEEMKKRYEDMEWRFAHQFSVVRMTMARREKRIEELHRDEIASLLNLKDS